MTKPLLEEASIEETIGRIPQGAFTVLDFIEVFEGLYPQDWKRLVQRFGRFGEKRRYTVNTYLSNRLDLYSCKACSPPLRFTRYREDRSKDFTKTTKE